MIAQTVGRDGSIWLLYGPANEPSPERSVRACAAVAMNPQSGATVTDCPPRDGDTPPDGQDERRRSRRPARRTNPGQVFAQRAGIPRRCPSVPGCRESHADLPQVAPMVVAAGCSGFSLPRLRSKCPNAPRAAMWPSRAKQHGAARTAE